ncbi:MAG: hypothetical protein AAFN77_24575 [Planctomycetota bacterium]
MNNVKIFIVIVTVCCGIANVGFAQQPLVEKYLINGKLSEGESALEKHLKQNPKDDQARFGLGTLQMMKAVEHLAQSWYRFGINDNLDQIPFFRLPVPENKNPERVSYQDVRNVFKDMIKQLDEADKTLAKITSKDVKLPLHLFQFHLDIDQDGMVTDDEDLIRISQQYLGGGSILPDAKAREVVVAFDYSDVLWMRGYTHLLRSMLEF